MKTKKSNQKLKGKTSATSPLKASLSQTKQKPTLPTASKVRVAIIESERGWGRKIDEVKEFDTLIQAQAFIKEYNSYNTSPTAPDWYMQAELMD